jgi:hypothetical protein
MASGPHIEANSVEPWRIRMLEGGRWSTNFTRSVWPKYMADQPHGGCSAVLLHINVVVKLGNHLSDTINTPICSTLRYTHSTVGYPLVKTLVL